MYWSKFVISVLIGIILCKVSQVDAACNPVGAFSCGSGDQCIPIRSRCDDDNTCTDGTDETDCGTCLSNEIPCGGFCLPGTWQCDGVEDCTDGSDEAGCTECNEWAFTCESDGECKPKSFTCNGTAECDNGEDEQDCTDCDGDHDFKCRNGECTQQCYVCDGERDCSDGSDEEDCDMFAVTGELCFAYPAAVNDLDIARECPDMGSACTPFTPVLLEITLSETTEVKLTGYDSMDNVVFTETLTAEMGVLTFTSLEEVDYIIIEIFWISTPGTYDIDTFAPCSRHNYCHFAKCEEMDSMEYGFLKK